jgi:hypothetical protein
MKVYETVILDRDKRACQSYINAYILGELET